MINQLLAQASLVERWFNTSDGMLGMSLTLNVVLLYICQYLLRLLMKRDTEKTALLENSLREIKMIYKEMFETTMDVTKAISELSTVVRGANR